MIPMLDFLLPHDVANIEKTRSSTYDKDKRFLLPLYAFWIADMVHLFFFLHWVARGDFALTMPLEFITFVFIAGHSGALGAVVGHELLHRRELLHKITGTLAYSKMMYSHFYIEHRKGHHTFVSTPRDPATAAKDESLYR